MTTITPQHQTIIDTLENASAYRMNRVDYEPKDTHVRIYPKHSEEPYFYNTELSTIFDSLDYKCYYEHDHERRQVFLKVML